MPRYRTNNVNVRGSMGRLNLNSRTGSSASARREGQRAFTRGPRGIHDGLSAPGRAASGTKGAIDTAEDDDDLQEGAESQLEDSLAKGAKKGTRTPRRGRKNAALRGGAGRVDAKRRGPAPGPRPTREGASLTRGKRAPGAVGSARKGTLGRGASSSAKGGLAAANKRAATRRVRKAAQKKARQVGGLAGLPTTPSGAINGAGRTATGAVRAAQLAVQAAHAAASTVRLVIAAVSAISSPPVLLTIVALVVALAAVAALIAIIPGSGEEAQKEEAIICEDGAAAVTADISNLPLSAAGYRGEQLSNAAIIIQAAKDSGLGRDAQLVGLITAMQESNLGANPAIALPNGDGDAGVFQQRQLDGWYGSLEEVTNPTYAAKAFFNGVTAEKPGDYGSVGGGPGYGRIPGLKDIDGWESMAPGDAAQRVQRSAHPDEYAKHVDSANELLNALGGTEVNLADGGGVAGCGTGVGGEATGKVADVIASAKSMLDLGLTYRLGGGTQDGPTGGTIDCSAFTSHAWKSGAGIDIGRSAQDQWNNLAASRVSVSEIQPGDLIFEAWGRRGAVGDPNAVSHVGMYIGNGQMIESSRSKNGPAISPARLDGDQLVGVARPQATDTEEDAS